MAVHQRYCRPLLRRKRQELRRKLAHGIAVKRNMAHDPHAIEDREQQQRIFGQALQALPPARSTVAPDPSAALVSAPHSL